MEKFRNYDSHITKFVVMKNEQGKLFLWGERRWNHQFKHIVMDAQHEDPSIQCLGGGYLEVYPNDVYAYSQSIDYGMADGALVEILLKECFPDRKLSVTMGRKCREGLNC